MSNHPNHDQRALLDLVDQYAGDDFDRALLSRALHQVMEAEAGEITGAGKVQRSPEERANLRNGYRRRDWDTRVGTIPLNIRRPYISATYLNPVLPVMPCSGAVRRVSFGLFSENRVHHILDQKCEHHKSEDFEKSS